eukprot:GILI01028412.1.p2 GENE.GILI01028412.1~~GILI01028412.1.p2  ORF type:complete len:230 (-),score=44.61 GILI01028412.1:32-694(-)
MAKFVVVALAALALCAFAAPTKPVWPQSFAMQFGLNDEIALPPIHNASAVMYYSWPIQQQRISYHTHCLPLAHYNAAYHPCDLYFNNVQGVVLVAPEAGVDCCTFVSGVGAVPPTFLQAFNFSSVETAPDMFGNEVSCNYWTGPGGFGYWTSVSHGIDVQFRDGPTGVYWNIDMDFDVAPQPSSLFTLPTTGNCSAPCSFFGINSHGHRDTMVALAALFQ